MTRSTSHLSSLSLLLLLGLAACGGAEGAVCQVADDCSSALICCKGSTSLTDRGTCETTCTAVVDAGPRDMSVTDLGSTDLGSIDAASDDAGMSEDLGADDMSMPVDLGTDAGMSVDLGPDDAGAEADASTTDAGDGG